MVTEYLIFEDKGVMLGRKTRQWIIRNKHSKRMLGRIEWYPPWRQYCYKDDLKAVYSRGCLRSIEDFLEKQMQEHKNRRNAPTSDAEHHLSDWDPTHAQRES